jgi:hypothetical protein
MSRIPRQTKTRKSSERQLTLRSNFTLCPGIGRKVRLLSKTFRKLARTNQTVKIVEAKINLFSEPNFDLEGEFAFCCF